ncbi:protein lava lamp [Drosophila busckii]|uniref:protein lava lamp n=1 Tax=Drosophila busckii TaxID=30019 RepID=UPI00083EBFEA|nr:protein lava lamp [Drosophila busckii]
MSEEEQLDYVEDAEDSSSAELSLIQAGNVSSASGSTRLDTLRENLSKQQERLLALRERALRKSQEETNQRQSSMNDSMESLSQRLSQLKTRSTEANSSICSSELQPQGMSTPMLTPARDNASSKLQMLNQRTEQNRALLEQRKRNLAQSLQSVRTGVRIELGSSMNDLREHLAAVEPPVSRHRSALNLQEQQQVTSEESQLKLLRNKLKVLELKQSRKELELEQKVVELRNELEKKDQELAERTQQNEQLEKLSSQTEEKPSVAEALESSSLAAQQLERQQEQLTELRARNSELEHANELLEATRLELHEAREKLLELEQQNQTPVPASTDEQVNMELAKQLQQLQQQLEQLQAERSEQQQQQMPSELEATVEQLQAQLAAQEDELAEKTTELNVLNVNMRLLEEKLAQSAKSKPIFLAEDTNPDADDQTEQLAQLKRQLDEANKVNIKLKLRCKKAENKLTQMQNKDETQQQLSKLQADNEQLQQRITMLEDEKGQLQLAHMEQEQQRESEQNEPLVLQLEERVQQLECEKLALDKQLSHYINENMELLNKVEKLSASSSAESIEIVERPTEEGEPVLEVGRTTPSFVSEVTQTDADAEVQESLSQLRAESDELLQRIELFSTERREVLAKLEQLQTENAALQAQLAPNLSQELSSMQRSSEVVAALDCGNAANLLENCEHALDKLSTELQAYGQANEQRAKLNACKKLAKQAKLVHAQLSELLLKVKESSSAVETVTVVETVVAVTAPNGKALAEYEQLTAQNLELKAALARMQAQQESQQAGNLAITSDQSQQLVQHEEELAKLRAQLKFRKQEQQRQRQQHDAQLAAKVTELDELQCQLDDYKARALELQSDSNQSDEQLAQLQTEQDALQQQLLKQQEQAEADKAQLRTELEQVQQELHSREQKQLRQRKQFELKLAAKNKEFTELESELSVQLERACVAERELQHQLERTKEQLQLRQQELMEVEHERATLSREATMLRLQQDSAEQDVLELQELRMQSIQDRTELENMRAQIDSLCANHTQELQALQQRIAELDTLGQQQTDEEAENKRLTAKVRDLQDQLSRQQQSASVALFDAAPDDDEPTIFDQILASAPVGSLASVSRRQHNVSDWEKLARDLQEQLAESNQSLRELRHRVQRDVDQHEAAEERQRLAQMEALIQPVDAGAASLHQFFAAADAALATTKQQQPQLQLGAQDQPVEEPLIRPERAYLCQPEANALAELQSRYAELEQQKSELHTKCAKLMKRLKEYRSKEQSAKNSADAEQSVKSSVDAAPSTKSSADAEQLQQATAEREQLLNQLQQANMLNMRQEDQLQQLKAIKQQQLQHIQQEREQTAAERQELLDQLQESNAVQIRQREQLQQMHVQLKQQKHVSKERGQSARSELKEFEQLQQEQQRELERLRQENRQMLQRQAESTQQHAGQLESLQRELKLQQQALQQKQSEHAENFEQQQQEQQQREQQLLEQLQQSQLELEQQRQALEQLQQQQQAKQDQEQSTRSELQQLEQLQQSQLLELEQLRQQNAELQKQAQQREEETSQQYAGQLDALQRELLQQQQTVQQKESEHAEKLEQLQREKLQSEQQLLEQLQQTQAELERQKQALEQLQQTQAELERQKQALEQLQAQQTSAPAPDMDALRQHWEAQMDQRCSEVASSWQQHLAQLEATHQAQLQQLTAAQAVEVSTGLPYETLLANLESENAELDHQKIELNTKLAKLMKRLKEYRAKEQQPQQKQQQQQSQSSPDLDGAIIEELRHQLQLVETRQAQSAEQLQQAATEREKLMKRIDVLSAGNERMTELKERQDMDVQMYQTRIRELQDKLQQLESWGDEPSSVTPVEVAATTTAPASDDRLEQLQTDNQELLMECQELKERQDTEAQQYQKRIRELQAKVEQLESWVGEQIGVSTGTQVSDDKLEQVQAENEELHVECQELIKQKQQLEQQLTQLQQQQVSLAKETEVNKFEAEKEQYQRSLEQAHQDKQQMEQQLASVTKQYKDQEQTIEQLQHERQQIQEREQQEKEQLQRELADLRVNSEQLAVNDESTALLQEKEAEIVHLKQRNQELMQENQTEALVLELLTKNQELQMLRMQVKQLEEDKLEHQAAHNTELQLDAVQQTQQAAELEQQLSQLQAEKHDMEEELRVLNNHVLASLELEDKLKQAVLQLDTKTIEISELRKSVETLQQQQQQQQQVAPVPSQDMEKLNQQWEALVEQKCGEVASSWQQHLAQLQAAHQLELEQLRATQPAIEVKTESASTSTANPQPMDASKLQQALEAQEMEIVTLKEQLAIRSAEYARLASQYDPFRLQGTRGGAAPTGADDTQAEYVPKSDLDYALMMLHQRDMRVEEMILELVQLLGERDHLQLKLSDTLRQLEAERSRLGDEGATGGVGNVTASSSSPTSGSPSKISLDSNSDLTASAGASGSDLKQKLAELQTIKHSKDKALVDEREQRLQQMMQLQRDMAKPANVSSQPPDIDSLQSTQRSPQIGLMDWIMGKSEEEAPTKLQN